MSAFVSEFNYDYVEKAQDRRRLLRILRLSRSFLFLHSHGEGGCCGLSACSISMQQEMMSATANSTGILGRVALELVAIREAVNA